MPVIIFCEECGEKIIVSEENLQDPSLEIECPACSEVNRLSAEDVKVLCRNK